MAQKNNALIVLGSLVVIGSVGYYLYTKSKKSNGAGSSEPSPDDKPNGTTGTTESSKDKPKGEPKGNPQQEIVSPYLATTDLVKKFQNWLDDNYPKWLKGKKLNKGAGWGNLGENTKSAWDSYGIEYINATKLADTQSKFKKGQFVTAKNTITARAVMVRNGKYMTTDGSGILLPNKKYNATADLGFVKAILTNGNVVLTVPPEIAPTYGTRIYTDILVFGKDIQ